MTPATPGLRAAELRILRAVHDIGRPALPEDVAVHTRLSLAYVTGFLLSLTAHGYLTEHRPTIGTWRPTFYEINRD